MNPVENKHWKLRASGRKATPQRLFILQAIEGMRAQFTSQQLYDRLQEKHPDIGLVTVYRTLSLLAESGLVCRMGSNGRSHSYASRPQEHHHHLVCTSCNRVVDLASCGLADVEKKLSRDTGFIISEHHLEFAGLCSKCQFTAQGEAK